uniref:U3 small nucleolar RNA-associated protein 15 homolog n=1 Tax=Pavo cristatus TaxID=9049 RepID=A0A8C9LEV3_PAVCR
MASYKPVVIPAVPKLGEKITQDTLYWRGYKVGRAPGPGQRWSPSVSAGLQLPSPAPAVHVVGFLSDKYRIFSGGDDYSSSLWDIPSATEIVSYSEHSDYVRCGCASKLNGDVFVTGSYDHTVKVFDARTKSSVMTIEHGHPVESVLLFPSGGLLVSAGGRYVKVWDVLKGGQLLVSLKNHHKTVTCLCLNSSGQRLLSGSLDRHVKIYSTTSYKVVHSFNYATSILSLALSPEDETIIVGMTNGVLNVKHRKPEESKEKPQKKRQPAYRTYVKGRNYMPKQVRRSEQIKPGRCILRKYDKLLKSFQSSKALDAVLEPHIRLYTPEVTVAVMQELNRRGTLRSALAGRDEKQISLLLTFVTRRVIEPRFTPVLITVADMITDIYQPVVGQSALVDKQFLRLQEAIGREIDYQEELLEVLGMMDALFATLTEKRATYLEENKSNENNSGLCNLNM